MVGLGSVGRTRVGWWNLGRSDSGQSVGLGSVGLGSVGWTRVGRLDSGQSVRLGLVSWTRASQSVGSVGRVGLGSVGRLVWTGVGRSVELESVGLVVG